MKAAKSGTTSRHLDFVVNRRYSPWISILLPNVQDEPRPWLARLVLLGARGVTAMVVGSGAWFGSVVFILLQISLSLVPTIVRWSK